MNDTEKAANAEALVRIYCPLRVRLLIWMLPPKWRKIAYVTAWDRLAAAREARRRLAI